MNYNNNYNNNNGKPAPYIADEARSPPWSNMTNFKQLCKTWAKSIQQNVRSWIAEFTLETGNSSKINPTTDEFSISTFPPNFPVQTHAKVRREFRLDEKLVLNSHSGGYTRRIKRLQSKRKLELELSRTHIKLYTKSI